MSGRRRGRQQERRGRPKGIKDATFGEKIFWLCRIQNARLSYAKRNKGACPSARKLHIELKKDFGRETPSVSSLWNWQKLGRADIEELEEAVKGKSKRGGNHINDTKFNDAMQAKIDAIFENDRYTTNKQLAAEIGTCVETAKKYKELAGWVVRKVRRITLLTPQHRSDRKFWCVKEEGNQMTIRAMIDEKQFTTGLPPATMSVKLEDEDYVVAVPNENDNDENEPPADVETPKKRKKAGIATDFVAAKKHGVKLMVTSCVMRPIRNADGTFKTTGKVGIWISKVTIEVAQRKSANHEKGEIYEKWGGSVDGEAYLGLIEREVFPAIDKMAKDMGIDTVEFQDDNASPHKKVRSEIEEAGKNRVSGIGIEPYKQPPRSPDLNVLDLYVWRVLSAGVNRRLFSKYRNVPKDQDVLWECIQYAWEHDLTPEKIEVGFRLIHPVMECIKDNNGGNNFRLPHSGIRKQMRSEGWNI